MEIDNHATDHKYLNTLRIKMLYSDIVDLRLCRSSFVILLMMKSMNLRKSSDGGETSI